MSFLLPLVLFLVFIACVAFTYTEGMWGNALRLINVVTAALLATNYFEPLAAFLEDTMGSGLTYYYDFASLWVLFVVFLLVFRLATKYASGVQVRFLGLADRIGSGVFAAWIGWVMVCFTTMTLHTAPLKKNFLFGGFKPGENMFVGTAPDQLWLGFMERMSKGPFARSTPQVFDPDHKFIPKYALRRTALDESLSGGSESTPPARMGGSGGGGSSGGSGGGGSGGGSGGGESS